jgi:serine/threonine-protein kinase
MSPEQADAAEVDGRSDLYSLGTIAYQCLSQRLPFQADSIVALMIARQRDKPRHLLELGIPVAIDPQLASVVMWLLERNVGSRPAGAGALMEILEGIASRLDAPSVARDDGALADTAAGEDMIATVVDGEATIDERTIEGRPKLPRRRRAVRPPRLTIARRLPQKRWWPWALLVLAVGTAFAAMATRLGRDPDPAPIPITVESPEVVDPAPPRPRLHIDSRPRGATISVRGDMLGQTPLDIEAPVGIDTATITLSLLGYRRWRGLAEKAYDFVLEVDLVPGIDVEAFIREPGVRWLAVELFAPWCAPCVKERPD